MGIHNLLPFLRKTVPSAFQVFQNSSNLKLAIDTPIFMYKYAYAFGNGKPLCKRMIQFVDDLREKNIEPTFVFDGGSVPQKTKRKNDVAKPNQNDYSLLKEALLKKQIIFYDAKFEAEALCAFLCHQNLVDGILTEDSDVLAYGSKNIILKWGHNPIQINAHDVANKLNLSFDQFQNFCILLGNDFNTRPKGYGPVKSLQLVKNQDFENIICNLPEEDSMKKTKIIFQSFCQELEFP